jgi:hypothetical protein
MLDCTGNTWVTDDGTGFPMQTQDPNDCIGKPFNVCIPEEWYCRDTTPPATTSSTIDFSPNTRAAIHDALTVFYIAAVLSMLYIGVRIGLYIFKK